jgi:hypothetical protein
MYSGLGARASRISRSPLWQYLQIAAARRLGTDALTEFDRHRYFELAVFPENAQIPVETICTLWRHNEGMQPDASCDLLLRLTAALC